MRWVRFAAAGIAFFVVAAMVLSFATLLLWNALVPELFHGPTLTFWQALGLLLLSHILLRGASPWRHRGGWHRDRWRHRIWAKLESMTPEERERFRQEWGHRCGWHSPEPKSDAGTT